MKHGWELVCGEGATETLLRDFVRPAMRAVPSAMGSRLGQCRVSLQAEVEPGVASRWSKRGPELEVQVATAGIDEHDVAMELLVCFGQALWEDLGPNELNAYWSLLREEIDSGIDAEIDEQALEEKRELLKTRSHAKSVKRLESYGCASFAGTAAEYVHCLWHEVTVRTGPDCLPAPQLRRRLEMLARWFPPDRGYRLFPRARVRACT